MKKLILTLTLSLSSIALATECPMERKRAPQRMMDPIDAIIAFNDMEKHQTGDWFDLERRFHDAKYALLKKQHEERANLHHRGLEALKHHGLNDQVLQKKLHHMLKLHERQTEEWRHLCEGHGKNAKKIYKQHKHEFEAFKRSL